MPDDTSNKLKSYRRLQYLEAFQAVVETGSVSEAARKLNTSQPSVSRMLAKLEEVSGVKLFIRSGGRLCVTSEAMNVKEEVDQLLSNLDRLDFLFNSLSRSVPKRLRLGTTVTLAHSIIPKILGKFTAEHPNIGSHVITGPAERMNQKILEGQIDLVIMTSLVTQPAVKIIPLIEAKYVCILPKDHPLAEKTCLEAKDFKYQKLILPAKSSPKRHEFQRLFAQDQVYTNAFVETSLVNVLVEMVGNTQCIGFANALMTDLVSHEDVVIRPFKSDITSNFGVVIGETTELNEYQKTFVRMFSDHVKSMNIDGVTVHDLPF